MSGRDTKSPPRSGAGFFNSLIGTLRRGGSTRPEPAPEPEDLGLKALRQVYRRYRTIAHPIERERQLYNLLPLFCANCSQYGGQQLVTKFPEVYEFAEDMALVFVTHVRQSAQASNPGSRALAILKYFEPNEELDSGGAGYIILKVVKVLAEGPESLVDVVMNGGVCSVLVQCVSLLQQLPPPAGGGSGQGSPCNRGSPAATPFGSYGSPKSVTMATGGHRSTPPFASSRELPNRRATPTSTPTPSSAHPTHAEQVDAEMAERLKLENTISGVLNKLLRVPSAVKNLVNEGHLSLLFGAISSSCPQYNKMWRKCAAHCLIAICRYSLTNSVIEYIHSKGCIPFCVHNLKNAMDQPPLEVVEIIATIFCCLKDSSDFSQVLLEDFMRSQGYKLVHDYLLHLETSSNPEAVDAERNLVLLIQNLVMAGFVTLEPTLTDGGPFQDPLFSVPIPVNQGSTVRNLEAFQVLQDCFLACTTSPLGLVIINALLYIFKSDPANYFIVESNQTLSSFLERMPSMNEDVQAGVLSLVEFVVVELKFVPTAELTNIGLLLSLSDHPLTVCLCLNFLLRLISYQSRFKTVFSDVGILIMLITTLKNYTNELLESSEQSGPDSHTGLSSPSLPLENIQGADEECMFLLMECLRATIEGVEVNGQVFRENGGTSCALSLVGFKKSRRMALKLLRQLILLEDGAVDFNQLLDYLNQAPQVAVNLKSEILQTLLGVFQLDSGKKAVFREVSGFHYMISVLASLLGSLAPRRVNPWTTVPRSDILHLVKLLFTVMTSAMQDDPANRNFFERDIRYDSFTAPLRLLGCFAKDVTSFTETTLTFTASEPHDPNHAFQTSGSFSNFEAEFKTWRQPGEHLQENSFVFCAAEIFRFLRDFALDNLGVQSTSLLLLEGEKGSEKSLHNREKNFYGAPPVTSKRTKGGSVSSHLVHPGAVLCMMDLLPSMCVSEDLISMEEVVSRRSLSPGVVEGRGSASPGGDREKDRARGRSADKSPAHLSSEGRGSPSKSPTHTSEDSFYDAEDDPIRMAVPMRGEGQGAESVEVVVESVEEGNDLSEVEMKQWCLFLQERVVSEIYALSVTERNQQALCQVGLPQRILVRCFGVLADESHPLHQALERTFEKLSYQALSPSDFRNFLRLGNPLCCFLNDITAEDLSSGKYSDLLPALPSDSSEDHTHNQDAPFGGSLSLARIQSLVTMTTPRDGCQPVVVGAPPFVEFDLSVDGFGCLFLPSIFPVSEASTTQTTPTVLTTSGVGEGGRVFPSSGGLSFVCWLMVSRYSANDATSRLQLLTLSQTLSGADKKVSHHPLLLLSLKPAEAQLVITTQLHQHSTLEDVAHHRSSHEVNSVLFDCPELLEAQSWYHLAVVMQKPGTKGKAKVTVYVNGRSLGTKKMLHMTHHPPTYSGTEADPILINAHIGTHVTHRHVSLLTYRLGPTFLFEEHLSAGVISTIVKLGPSYLGSFQAPRLQDTTSANSTHGHTLPPLVSEDRLLFGLIATHPLVKTVHELNKMYTRLDVTAIRKELSLTEDDDITPVTLLHNTAVHLYGPSRTLGAIMCGYSGIRFFQPQPLRSLLSSVGGIKVVLGLVAMATTVDNLYASMKALVCIVGNNEVALREMERTGGFKVLGMLLRSKSRLINSNILHLTYTLVGTVDSEQESARIPNLIAFQDLLADLAVWSNTDEDIQRSLFSHFFDLLSHTSHKAANAEKILNMKMVSLLLFRLLDESLTIRTIKSICNVISALIGILPKSDDIQRLGQLLATTLPSNRSINENIIDLYEDDEGSTQSGEEATERAQFGRFRGDEGKQQRAIVLRNILLDVLISLLMRDLDLNTQFAHELYQSLGFDWLFLFMHATIHTETVVRALRILVQLLADHQLKQHFLTGDIFGGWVRGFDTISMEMTNLVVTSLTYLNPFQPPTQQIPGPIVLAHLLPNHADLSQIYLLLSANLLGQQCTDIPFNARFDMETLEEVFNIGDQVVMAEYKVSGDAAYVLLTVARTLLHKDLSDRQLQENAVNLVKFFERLYKSVHEFRRLASSQEFIEALIATLFPPPTYQDGTPSVSDGEGLAGEGAKVEHTGEDWIMIEPDVLPGTGGKEEGDAILTHCSNLAVCTILKLLRTIAIDGFSSAMPMTKDSAASCPILERILNSTPPGISPKLMKQYQTLLLQNMMDYLQAGSEDIMVLFREGVLGANVERALCGLSVFCTRLVDKVWQQCFLNPTHSVYNFLFWLLEQARITPKQMPLMDLQRSLNRLVLYQVASVPSSEAEQRALMEMLCLYSSQAHVIFDETNIEDRFLECLTYCLLRIALYEKFLAKNPLLLKLEDRKAASVDTSSLHGNLPSGYVPGSLAMMKSGANRLWTKMLEYKKADLERLLHVELPSPGDNHHRDALASHMQQYHPSMGNKTFLKLQNCHLFLTDNLEKTWKDFLTEERNSQTLDSIQREASATPAASAASTIKKGAGIVATMASRVRKKKGTAINKHDLVQEFVSVLSHLLILASQKFYELLLRKHQRTVEYRLRFAASEWSKIEYELTRERGLWGPEKPTSLDKWMVDIVEGPCRMRKRLQRNHDFYRQYPYQPHIPAAVKTKYQKPCSSDSELHATRERLFQRPTILATPSQLTSSTEEEARGDQAADKAGETATDQQPPQVAPSLSSNKLDVFNHPDSDDPVAQTLYKMIEPDDRVTKQYQCARLTGLDSRDGVLLLGTTHFYVIEGITITNTGDIVDIESAARDSYDPVVPSSIHSHEHHDKSQVPIQCMKWGYDTIREVHKRRYLLRHCAVEVFSSDGRSHFLIFHPKYRDKVYQRLLSLSKSSLTQSDSASQYIAGIHPEMDPGQSQGLFSVLTGERSLVEKWVNGEMSNFQYLMHLNTLAGRSYNDLMQYPIFPWILSDYTSETLDFSNPKIFRDLSKPMGAQSEPRLKRFIERYKYFEDPTGENTPPYYYGTHYSSAMIVASYLIRMEPFSQYFLKLQGGHFDLPDRLFHSIPDAWRSASETNMADIKELIPEFFYLPEFMVNSNNFELGVKQSGERLGSIILPPWSKGDPHEFIRVHREALECDYVSANLHKWIDLIFGYKQKGEEALVNHNVFHHLFYEGAVDIDKIEDPMKKNAAISFIHNFGQMPKQLFKKPHRQRKVISVSLSQDPSTSNPPLPNLLDSRRVFYRNLVQLMPSKEPIKSISTEVNQIVCPSENRLPLAVDKNKIFLPWANYKYYFVWGFPDHSARIATIDTEKIISVFEGLHQGRILCSAIADDTTLLTGGESTVVCVWEVSHSGGKERVPTQLHLKQTLHGHTAAVSCITTSASYNLILSGSKDKTCILWDLTNFSFVRQLCDHSGPVTVVTINQLNGNIVTCTKNQIRLWTVNGTLLAETPLIMSSSTKILCCAVSELFDWDKENVIVTGSSDGIVRMWQLEYVSEEMMAKRRGSPADSMLSGVSGGESTLDFTLARERLSSNNVLNKLKKSSLSRNRSKSTPEHADQLLSEKTQEEMFRSTGQMPKPVSFELPQDDQVDFGPVLERSSTPDGRGREEFAPGMLPKKSAIRTFSEEEEEERTAGSGTDITSDRLYYPSSSGEGVNELANEAANESGSCDVSHDTSQEDQHVSCEQVAGLSSEGEGEREGEGEGATEGQDQGEKEEKGKPSEDKAAEVNPSYAKYMSERRKEAEELKQRTGKWVRRLKLVHTLTMHTSIHRKDNEKPCSVTSVCISKDHRRLFIGDALGRIFSWTVSDNLGGVMQHWVLDHAVDKCYKCGVEFTFTERKHHCRDCGQIFCARCSNYEIEVERLRIFKKVRVCAICYDNITLEKTKHIFRAPSDIDV